MKKLTRKIVGELGGPTKLGPMLGITPQAISLWEEIPLARAAAIERITNGRYTIQEMRPDLFEDSRDVA